MKKLLIGAAVVGLLLYWSNAGATEKPSGVDGWSPDYLASFKASYNGKIIESDAAPDVLFRVENGRRISYQGATPESWITLPEEVFVKFELA